MGKKKLDVMEKEREIFINGQVDENGNIEVPGCVRNGIDAKSANTIFDEMAEFAKYAFNKSHAACYAVVAYRTAYLKTYYPAEFMAATLNSYLGNLDKVPQYIDECKRLGIEILKPDINKSFENFTVAKATESEASYNFTINQQQTYSNIKANSVRFGLGSIKNVGMAPVENIVKERMENGPYKGFADFCERIADNQVNKKCVESLIKAGVFDEFEETRATLLASFETIIDVIQSGKKKGLDGQVSMFDLGNEKEKEEMEKQKYQFEVYEELQEKELLSMEKEMLGIYISGHPLEKLRHEIMHITNINTRDIIEINEQNNIENIEEIQNKKPKFKDGQKVRYAGIITSIKKKYTKNNKIMAFVAIEDLYGVAEIVAFENVVVNAGESLIEENIVIVDGRLSIREDQVSIVANEIKNFGEEKPNILSIDITDFSEEQKSKLRSAIKYFSGDKNNINVEVVIEGEAKPCGAIYYNDEIKQIFKEI